MTVLSRGDCEPAYCRRLTLVLVFPLPHSRIAGKLQQKDILRRPHPVYHCDGCRTPEPLCGSFFMCFWTTIEDCSIKAKCCLPAVHCQDNTFGQNKRHLGFHQGNRSWKNITTPSGFKHAPGKLQSVQSETWPGCLIWVFS